MYINTILGPLIRLQDQLLKFFRDLLLVILLFLLDFLLHNFCPNPISIHHNLPRASILNENYPYHEFHSTSGRKKPLEFEVSPAATIVLLLYYID